MLRSVNYLNIAVMWSSASWTVAWLSSARDPRGILR